MAESLAQLTVRDLLERVAARTPAPGGGSASALAGGLAAALVQMAARFDRDGRSESIGERAQDLRGRALELADVELESYGPVLEAMRLPAEDPERPERIARASREAARPPVEIARLLAEVAELGAELAAGGNRHLVGDAIAGTLLAEAACRAAAQLVALNLAGHGGKEMVSEARRAGERAAGARSAALASVAVFPSDDAG